MAEILTKLLQIAFSPQKPWHRQVVEGFVSPFPLSHTLGKSVQPRGEETSYEALRRAFWARRATRLVLRPNLSLDPWEHYTLPMDLPLKVGEKIVAQVKPEPPPSPGDKPEEENFRLGQVIRVLEAPPPGRQWPMQAEVLRSPQPLFPTTTRLGRALRLLGTSVDVGNATAIVGAGESGKSRLLAEMAIEASKQVDVVVYALIGEREKDIAHARFLMQERPNIVLFGVPGTQSVERKLGVLEMAIYHAMSCAGRDLQVVFILDSGTKSLIDPLSQFIGAPEDVGIQEGGINPLAFDALALLYGLARALPDDLGGGSITAIVSVLNTGGRRSRQTIEQARSLSDGLITLNPAACAARVFWPFYLGEELVYQEGQWIAHQRTTSRTQTRYEDPEFTRATFELRAALSLEHCLEEVHKEWETDHPKGPMLDRDRANIRAGRKAVERLKRFYKLLDEGRSDAAIFRAFGIEFAEPRRVEAQQEHPARRIPEPTQEGLAAWGVEPPAQRGDAIAAATRGWLQPEEEEEPT